VIDLEASREKNEDVRGKMIMERAWTWLVTESFDDPEGSKDLRITAEDLIERNPYESWIIKKIVYLLMMDSHIYESLTEGGDDFKLAGYAWCLNWALTWAQSRKKGVHCSDIQKRIYDDD